MSQPLVLITGCSSGIGAALARAFAQRGARVVATARNIDSLKPLCELGIIPEQLDVNDPNAAKALYQKYPNVDILVNNAGFALIGPSIELEAEDLRFQMETNLVAPLVLSQIFAQGMKEKMSGKIVNVGSISGIATTPFSGAYCASKAALHSLGDALRMELAPFGIQVITVQPGAIASNFGNAAAKTAAKVLKTDSWYTPIEEFILKRAEISQQGATPADTFAKEVVNLLLKPLSPPIIRKGKKSIYLPTVKKYLPVRTLDKIMKKKFGLNQKL